MTRSTGGDLETATYLFHAGTVVKNPIVSTVQDMNLQVERAAHPNDVGTYSLQSGQLVLTMTSGKQQEKFEPESEGCFGWDAGVFCPVNVFKPGATLDGTFSGGASVGGGAVMSNMTISFKSDGTYQRESLGSFSSTGTRSAVTGSSAGSERGKYRIEGTALHLMPEGGKETVVSTFPYDDGSKGPAPRSVYFGGGMLETGALKPLDVYTNVKGKTGSENTSLPKRKLFHVGQSIMRLLGDCLRTAPL